MGKYKLFTDCIDYVVDSELAYDSILESFKDFDKYVGIVSKKEREFIELLNNHFEQNEFTDSKELGRYVAKNYKYELKPLLYELNFNKKEIKELYTQHKKNLLQDVLEKNPKYIRVVRSHLSPKILMDIDSSEQLFTLFKSNMRYEFPNIYTEMPRKTLYPIVESILEKWHNKFHTARDVINYLTDEKRITDRDKVETILKAYETLGSYHERYVNFNKNVVDNLTNNYSDSISHIHLAKEYFIFEQQELQDTKYKEYTANKVHNFPRNSYVPEIHHNLMFKKVLNYVQENLNKSETPEQNNIDLEIIGYNSDKSLLTLKSLNVTYYVHPLFMVSDLNRKIWVNCGNVFNFEEPPLELESDRHNKKHLNYIAKVIGTKKPKILPLQESDFKRFQRLKEFSKQEVLTKYDISNVKTTFADIGRYSYLLINFKDVNNKERELYVTPIKSSLDSKSFIYCLKENLILIVSQTAYMLLKTICQIEHTKRFLQL